MFWNRFFDECSKKGTSPNAVCKAIGLSNATATGWKNGTLPKADVLVKIADHLNVSVDYLLGREESTRDMVYEHSDADDDAIVKEELMELLGFDGKKEEHKICMDFGTTNTVTEKAPHISARSFTQGKYKIITIEPKTIEKWTNDIAQLNSENRNRLQDYLELLLKSQDQGDQEAK